ncbi:hypothetical protein O9X98_06535 [Agrobacterium salinitolerans]|nr:hypothetical protein [Agrobacterium salinitolerans]
MIEQLVEAALARYATDVQGVPENHALRVFERIDGTRRLVAELDKEAAGVVLTQIKNRSAMDLTEGAKEQFGEFEWGSDGRRSYVCAATFVDEEGREGFNLSFVRQPFHPAKAVTHARAAQTATASSNSQRQPTSRGSMEYGI